MNQVAHLKQNEIAEMSFLWIKNRRFYQKNANS